LTLPGVGPDAPGVGVHLKRSRAGVRGALERADRQSPISHASLIGDLIMLWSSVLPRLRLPQKQNVERD
jgi:hypothetical protein